MVVGSSGMGRIFLGDYVGSCHTTTFPIQYFRPFSCSQDSTGATVGCSGDARLASNRFFPPKKHKKEEKGGFLLL